MLDQRSETAVMQLVRAVLAQIQTAPVEEEPTTEFLTVNEVAKVFRVSRETVRRMCASGRLPALDCASGTQANYRIPRPFVDYALGQMNAGRNIAMGALAIEWKASIASNLVEVA